MLTQLEPDRDCTYAYGVVPFANALCVWVTLQQGPVTVEQAAAAFNATPEVIRVAVAANRWMTIDRRDVIETDGE